jgi:hypothetical protein
VNDGLVACGWCEGVMQANVVGDGAFGAVEFFGNGGEGDAACVKIVGKSATNLNKRLGTIGGANAAFGGVVNHGVVL